MNIEQPEMGSKQAPVELPVDSRRIYPFVET